MNSFVNKLLNPSAEKTALFNQASELQRQADVNKRYASAAVRTFAATGRESCLIAESAHLAAAARKEEQASQLIDAALTK